MQLVKKEITGVARQSIYPKLNVRRLTRYIEKCYCIRKTAPYPKSPEYVNEALHSEDAS